MSGVFPGCPSCSQEYNTKTRVPRKLPCGHRICHECVKQSLLNGKLKCPICSNEYKPANGATSIPVDKGEQKEDPNATAKSKYIFELTKSRDRPVSV